MTLIILKSIVVWFILMVAESLNGTARIFWLIPWLGDTLAHQVSFAIGSLLILAIATLLIPWIHPSHISQCFAMGILWLLLTVIFEVSLGLFVLGYSWQQISADYNVLQGGLMPFGLVWLILTPPIAAKIRKLSL